MVCLGNICRSPLAEGILKEKTKHLNVKVDSAGTAAYHIGKKPDIRSIEIAEKYNIDISQQRARQFSKSDFDYFDKIYAMDTQNYTDIIKLSIKEIHREKVYLILDELNDKPNMSVPDPYYGEGDGFQKVYNMLDEATEKILQKLER